MRFILCLTWQVCIVPHWGGNISDFAPLHLEKNRAPKHSQIVPLRLLELALKGALERLGVDTGPGWGFTPQLS